MSSPHYYTKMERELRYWDRALDAEVHRVVFGRCPHPEADHLRFSKAKVMPKGAVMCSHCGRDPMEPDERVPGYSSNLDIVAIQMENIGAPLHLHGIREQWTARFGTYPDATGPTAGIAVCRAAIAAHRALEGRNSA